MPGKMNIQVEGAQAIVRRFEDPKVIVKPLKAFLTEAAKDMQKEAKGNAPVGSGDLRRSIRRSVRSKRRIPVKARVFTKLYYGRFLEHGTKQGLAPVRFLQRALVTIKSTLDQRTRRLQADITKHLRGDIV